MVFSAKKLRLSRLEEDQEAEPEGEAELRLYTYNLSQGRINIVGLDNTIPKTMINTER